jgi:hypothetical protein
MGKILLKFVSPVFCGDEQYARTDAGRLGWVGHKKHEKVKNLKDCRLSCVVTNLSAVSCD